MEAVVPCGTSLAGSLAVTRSARTMATREDREMSNVQLWILLWQKQINDKHERARAAA
jgi:hypothetical protein